MPSAPACFRASAFLLVCAGGLAACTGLGPKAQVSPESPSISAVTKARYANPVDLDHGGMLVLPPPAAAHATVPKAEADAMFEAADAVQGQHAFAIFGLGVVTVAPRTEKPAPTTTTTTTAPPPPPSTVPPTTAPARPPPPPPTTTAPTTTAPTTTLPPPSTTTTPTAVPAARLVDSTSTTAAPPTTAVPPTTTPTTPVLPTYRRRLAWVGIAWGAPTTCDGSTTTQPVSVTSTTYVAIVIDARTGGRVLAYRSGGSSPCGGPSRPPSVTEPSELLSVAWEPVGPASTAVQIQVPPCGRYYGWTQMPTTGTGIADQVVVAVPFDPTCGATAPQNQPIDQVVPLGAGQALVGHAAVGPIKALQTLPTG